MIHFGGKNSSGTAYFPTRYCLDVTEHQGCDHSSASCMKPIRITILLMSEDHATELPHSRISVRVHFPPSIVFALETGNK